MNITASNTDKVCTLAVEGDIDTLTAPELDKTVEESAKSCEKLILDLTEVEYLSSAGIRSLIKARQVLGKNNFVVRNPGSNILEILRMTGFDKVLTIE